VRAGRLGVSPAQLRGVRLRESAEPHAGLRETYDEALEDVDALVLPTTPGKPPAHGGARGLEALLEPGDSAALFRNTGPFNASHHPGLTVPCGTTDGAPVGMMFVGERFDDATLLALGHAYEQYTD